MEKDLKISLIIVGLGFVGYGMYSIGRAYVDRNKNNGNQKEEKSNIKGRTRTSKPRNERDIFTNTGRDTGYWCMYRGKDYGYWSTEPCAIGDIDITPKSYDFSGANGDLSNKVIAKQYIKPVYNIW